MNSDTYHGGENFTLRDVLVEGRALDLNGRLRCFDDFISRLNAHNESLYMREIHSSADREVVITDPVTREKRRMLMFGSNNYLGLASHPYVAAAVRNAIDRYGTGIGGPPLLNGHTHLHAELERRIAAFKHTEDAVIFSSGYAANVGLVSALATKRDRVVYDEYSHASFIDGLTMSHAAGVPFRHNDVEALERVLNDRPGRGGDVYVGVEGVYSMDGDRAPLVEIAALCSTYGAHLLLDDAHGTGVQGAHGRGTAEHFGMEGAVEVTLGTFSKAFGVVGGFVAGSRELVQYLRFFSRSHMFSASLPPTVIAAVLAGLAIVEADTGLLDKLRSNIAYCAMRFREIGIDTSTDSPIISLRVPASMNIRKAAYHFHKEGIFVNSIEYPAVPAHQQRFRISLMATHTKADIDTLVACVEDVWRLYGTHEQPAGVLAGDR